MIIRRRTKVKVLWIGIILTVLFVFTAASAFARFGGWFAFLGWGG